MTSVEEINGTGLDLIEARSKFLHHALSSSYLGFSVWKLPNDKPLFTCNTQ